MNLVPLRLHVTEEPGSVLKWRGQQGSCKDSQKAFPWPAARLAGFSSTLPPRASQDSIVFTEHPGFSYAKHDEHTQI